MVLNRMYGRLEVDLIYMGHGAYLRNIPGEEPKIWGDYTASHSKGNGMAAATADAGRDCAAGPGAGGARRG